MIKKHQVLDESYPLGTLRMSSEIILSTNQQIVLTRL